MIGSILTRCFKAFRNQDSLLLRCGLFLFLGMAIRSTPHLLRQTSCFFKRLIESSISGYILVFLLTPVITRPRVFTSAIFY